MFTNRSGSVGIPIIFARDFCDSGGIEGGAMGPDVKLMVKSHKAETGQRGDDLCGVPRRLTPADITNTTRRPFVHLIEQAQAPNAPINLAHELGHNLFLGHGNGFDDNADGKPAGTRAPSPRRYDEYCDPEWLLAPDFLVLAEEAEIKDVDCPKNGSLMSEKAPCPVLRPLQVETARAVAKVMPGFADGSPGPAGVDPHTNPGNSSNKITRTFGQLWSLVRRAFSWL